VIIMHEDRNELLRGVAAAERRYRRNIFWLKLVLGLLVYAFLFAGCMAWHDGVGCMAAACQ
jgi:hypothetical protein